MVLTLELPDAPIELTFPEGLSHEAFEKLCFDNRELVVERAPDGKINIMSPVSTGSGDAEAEFIADLKIYSRQFGGNAFSSSTGFTLPDGSVRSPGAAYVSADKMSTLSAEDLKHFAAITPDFIVEVISPSDSLADAQEKISKAWLSNGVAMAWLVSVHTEQVWVYRQNGSVDLVEDFDRTIDGEDVLPGFVFDLRNLL